MQQPSSSTSTIFSLLQEINSVKPSVSSESTKRKKQTKENKSNEKTVSSKKRRSPSITNQKHVEHEIMFSNVNPIGNFDLNNMMDSNFDLLKEKLNRSNFQQSTSHALATNGYIDFAEKLDQNIITKQVADQFIDFFHKPNEDRVICTLVPPAEKQEEWCKTLFEYLYNLTYSYEININNVLYYDGKNFKRARGFGDKRKEHALRCNILPNIKKSEISPWSIFISNIKITHKTDGKGSLGTADIIARNVKTFYEKLEKEQSTDNYKISPP